MITYRALWGIIFCCAFSSAYSATDSMEAIDLCAPDIAVHSMRVKHGRSTFMTTASAVLYDAFGNIAAIYFLDFPSGVQAVRLKTAREREVETPTSACIVTPVTALIREADGKDFLLSPKGSEKPSTGSFSFKPTRHYQLTMEGNSKKPLLALVLKDDFRK